MRRMGTPSILATALSALMFAGGFLLLSGPVVAQPEPWSCFAVYGTGNLWVHKWIDEEPFVVRGKFTMAIDTPDNMERYLADNPHRLEWIDANFTLLAMPGSDAPLPGGLGWAPCSSSWTFFLPTGKNYIESFCESILVPDPDEGPDIYEMIVREEIAWVKMEDEIYDCGRLYINGPWDATLDKGEVEVAGKFCACP